MKSKLTLVLIITAVSTLLFSCSPTPKQVSVEASCDDFTKLQQISKQVEVAIGDSFTVTLCSNLSTGFQWTESAQISDQTVLEQTDHKVVAPEAKGDEPPAPGTAWTRSMDLQGSQERHKQRIHGV